MWLRPVKPENAPFALRAALREYEGLLTRSIPMAEIQRYRTFLTRIGALEQLTASRRLGYAMDDLTYGLSHPYLEAMREGWQGLDEANLADAVRRHLVTRDLAIVLVAKDGAALAASLVAGTPARPPSYESPKPASVTAADVEIARFPLHVTADRVRVVPAADLFKE